MSDNPTHPGNPDRPDPAEGAGHIDRPLDSDSNDETIDSDGSEINANDETEFAGDTPDDTSSAPDQDAPGALVDPPTVIDASRGDGGGSTTTDSHAGGLPSDDKLWAMLAHLAGLVGYVPIVPGIGMIIGPLVIWAIKKNEMPFVDQQGKEALNFQLTIFLIVVVLSSLSLIPFAACITVPIMFVLAIVHIIYTIIAAISANDGKPYVYPVRIEFFT